MKVTRERKIIGAVLVIALAGLGFDQLRGASSTTDASADASTLLVTGKSSSHKPARVSATMGEEVSFASRLATLAHTTGNVAPNAIRDVFRPADSWLPKVATIVNTVSAADKFVMEHKLSMVSVNTSGGGVAVVDGKLLHIGASLDGYQLIAIDQQSASFRSADGARALLKLPTETAAAR